MTSSKDIAIIGMAGRFPDARTLGQLHENLRSGVDSIRPITEERVAATTLPPEAQYRRAGYLADVDKFDHAYFNIAKGEAQNMDPIVRLLLEVVHEAIESAGYAADAFSGTRCAVFVGDASTEYYKHADGFAETLITGNSPSFFATRVTKQFNLTGNALMVNTACSSSHVALHMAVNELLVGEADCALVCGANLYLFPFYDNKNEMDVWSSDGKSRAFSEDANGMSNGEVVAAVLLKPLDRAVADGDPVHAVIRGTAINNNANRSKSPYSPDSVTQSEVIRLAWKKAGVRARDVGFIEAHGSGTQLGDMLEIEGLNGAFAPETDATKICPISAVKSSAGHGMSGAGIFSLIKTVLQLKHREIYPTLHVERLNPLIDFEKSPVYVNRALVPWEPGESGKRVAGVTSLGASGTNVHVVVEEAPARAPAPERALTSAGQYLVPLSARTEASLAAMRGELREFLARERPRLADVASTLGRGRRHHDVRAAIVASSLDELVAALADVEPTATKRARTLWLLGEAAEGARPALAAWGASSPAFASHAAAVREIAESGGPRGASFALGYAAFKTLVDLGLEPSNVVPLGVGRLALLAARGELAIADVPARLSSLPDSPLADLDERAAKLVASVPGAGPLACVDLADARAVSDAIGKVLAAAAGPGGRVASFARRGCPAAFLAELYRAGVSIDWARVSEQQRGDRIPLPGYSFARTRCWLREKPRRTGEVELALFNDNESHLPVKERSALDDGGSEIELTIAGFWCEALDRSSVLSTDDFFALGGDSLRATKVISAINRHFESEIAFEDLYDAPTVKELAALVVRSLGVADKVALLWREVLKVESVAPADNFFDLGGHSLLASQILVKLRVLVGAEVDFDEFYANPTLEAFTRYVEQKPASSRPKRNYEVTKAAPRELYPTSSSQRRLWVLSQLDEGTLAYNSTVALEVRGPVDAARLGRALQAVVDRHESLRTVFVEIDGKPWQKILPAGTPPSFEVVDLTAAGGDVDARAAELVANEEWTPFDLAAGPLMRTLLVRLEPKRSVLAVTMHHTVSDGWSAQVFAKDLLAAYEAFTRGAPDPLRPLPFQYKDFACWIADVQSKTKAWRDAEGYWLEQFSGDVPVLELPTDRPRSALQTFRGRTLHAAWRPDFVRRLEGFCRAEKITLYAFLVGVVNVLLQRHTGQDDVVVGSVTAGRVADGLDDQIGCYVNTFALRTRLDAEEKASALMRRVGQSAVLAVEHAIYPFDALVEKLTLRRDPSRSALFDVLVVLQNITDGRQTIRAGELSFAPFGFERGVSQFDITFEFETTAAGLELHLQYNTELFDEARMARMQGHLRTLAQGIVDGPDTPLFRLPLLTPAEAAALASWNAPAGPFGAEMAARPTFVHAYLDRVRRSPDAAAVSWALGDARGSFTYREFDARVSAVASALRAAGAPRESVVALLDDRGPDLMSAIVGALAAGLAYVPLDPAHPPARLRQVLEQANARFAIVASAHRKALAECGHAFDAVLPMGPEPSAEGSTLATAPPPLGLAYVIFTSGSTGVPKGAMVEHGGMLNHLHAKVDVLGLTAADVVAQTASQCFDISVWQFLVTTLVGGRVHVIGDDVAHDPSALLDVVVADGVTVLEVVPSMLRAILDEVELRPAKPSLAKLRWMVATGEALPPDLCARWFAAYPAIPLLNAYGPTECSDDVTHFAMREAPAEDAFPLGNVPIGLALPNCTLHVLDRYGTPVPVGVPGELYIGGTQVGRGYLGRPDLTAERFLPCPFGAEPGARMYRSGDLVQRRADGAIEFLGRIDHQVKVRGFRIELGEIELALRGHAGVRDVAVIVREDRAQDKRIVAYVVLEAEGRADDLAAFVREKLPNYMVPSAFVALDALPLTSNGKLDRKALPAPDADAAEGRTPYVAPRNDVERLLAEVWADVLGVERVGVQSNFFELGGDSILAIQVVSRSAARGLRVTPKQLFQAQTIADLAPMAEAVARVVGEQGLVTGEVPLTPIMRGFLTDHVVDRHHYNQAVFLELPRGFDASRLEDAARALVAHHDVLRLRVPAAASGELRAHIVEGSPPPFVTIVDLSRAPDDALTGAVERAAAELQASLDLENGPIFRFARFDLGAGRAGRLLLVVHHLAIDGVSWRILLEDLATVSQALAAGQTPKLPPKTTSFVAWAERIQRHAASPEIEAEASFWADLPWQTVRPLPKDADVDSRVGDADSVAFELTAEETNELLRSTVKAYRLQINDVLLTALAAAFERWTGSPTLLVDLESHGREELFDDVDVSRTVGWFTAIYPLLLTLPRPFDAGEALKAVKEQLRAIPNHGVGFGILERLHAGAAGDRVRALPKAEIIFNYLGQFDRLAGEAGFAAATEPSGPAVSPRAHRRHAFEISAMVLGGAFSARLYFDPRAHATADVRRLAGGFGAALRELIAHGRSPEAYGFTPSDFPLVRPPLAQRTLDAILAGQGGARGVEDVYPLSPLQAGMVFHSTYAPRGLDPYLNQLTCRLPLDVDVDALVEAWRALLARHTSLRSSFVTAGVDRPLQVVHRSPAMPVERLDWPDLEGDAVDPAVDAFLRAERERGFDLRQAPLMRVALIRSRSDVRLVWSFHHLLLDGWSLPILLNELFTLYHARRTRQTPELPARRPFREHIAWLALQSRPEAEAFWRQALEGFVSPTSFDATALAASRGDSPHGELHRALSKETTDALAAVARKGHVTLNTLVQGAWSVLLSAYSGQEEVVFGATVSGRSAAVPGVDAMVGLFINTIPVRVTVAPDARVGGWLEALQAKQAELRRFEHSPLVDIQAWSALPRGTPLFDSIVVFENYPIESSLLQVEDAVGIAIDGVRFLESSNYPVTLVVAPGTELGFKLSYDRERFDEAWAEALLRRLEHVLAGFVDLERRVGALDLLGPIERKAPPAAATAPAAEKPTAYVAPRSRVERILAEVWAEVLGVERVGIHDDFFDLGGDSMLAFQVVNRAAAGGVVVTLRDVFEAVTVAELAPVCESAAAPAGELGHAPPLPRDGGLPLSFAQQRLWFLDQLQPGHAFYNISVALSVRGRVDVDALRTSLRWLVRRHESLRTSFVAVDGEPLQVIAPDADVALEVVDAPREEAERLANEAAKRPFDLSRGPLFRALLVRVSQDEAVLALTVHHVVSDEWSMGIVARDLGEAYAAFAAGRVPASAPLPIQYADFAAWQRGWLVGARLDAEIAWWKAALAGTPESLELPFDRPRPPQPMHRGETLVAHVPKPVADAIAAVGKKLGATTFMTLLAAFQVLLAKYSGQDDVVVGSPTAGRTHGKTEGLVGFFVNTLVLRARVRPGDSFRALLARVRTTSLEAYEHQDLPFEKLVEEVQPTRDPSRSPIFQVMFVLQNDTERPATDEALSFQPVAVETSTAKFDLTLLVHEAADGLHASFEFDTDLFDRSTIERMAHHFGRLLDVLAQTPDAPLGDVSLVDDAERRALEASAHGAVRPLPPDETAPSVILARAARTPEAIAASWPTGSMTYAELERRSGAVAAELRRRGAARDAVVAILDERGPSLLVAILGVLRSGAAYVPIEAGYPPARVREILAASRVRLALAGKGLGERLEASGHELAAVLETDALAANEGRLAPGESAAGPGDLAYVIFTSGSTGAPKGAMVEHRGMLNHLLAKVEDLGLTSADVVAETASQCFDISVWQFLVALLTGGRTHVYPDAIAHDPRALLDAVERDGVTVLEVVPSLLRAMLDEIEGQAWKPSLAKLRWMVATGEALPPDLCARWFAAYPAIPLMNAYGPTECSDDVTHYVMRAAPEGSVTPIGHALRNTRLYVVSKEGQLVPPGVAGELWVGGVGVGRGYIGDVRRTTEVFVPDPFVPDVGARAYRTGDLVRRRKNGALEFLGRIDHQVKVRGYRIELGEIEVRLRAHAAVKDAAVVVREARPGDKRLVAYVVAEGLEGGELASELSTFLREKLPDYMVPSAFVALNALPLTANGKLDRNALPSPGEDAIGSTYVAPRGPLEQSLADIWALVLGIPRVGVHDNFFELGGHSLLATQVVARIRSALHRELPLRTIFEAPTVARLAVALASSADAGDAFPLTATRRDGPSAVSFAQERLWFLDQLEPGGATYNIPAAIRLTGPLDVDALRRAFEAIVRRHDSLRTTFRGEGGQVRQVVSEDVRATLQVVALDGVAVDARDEALRRHTEDEAATPFDLARGPLVRASLLRLAADQHVFLFTVHHIVSDGWSLGVIVNELGALYTAFSRGLPSPLAPLALQYPDYAAWQRRWLEAGELQRQLAYWRAQLAGAPPSLDLPTDQVRPPVFSFRGRTLGFVIPRDLANELRALATREGATLFMVLLAAFDLLLARYSGQSDLVVGTPIANRTRRELEPLVGFFVNTLALRARVERGATFRSLVASVKQTTLDAYAHQDVPFERLVEDLAPARDASRTPLFQVMFALQNAPVGDVRLPGVALEPLAVETKIAKFDLTLVVEDEAGDLDATLEYATDLFERATIERMADNLLALLRAVAAEPAAKLSDLPLLSERERHTLLVAWNDTRAQRPGSVVVHELVAAQVARTPDAAAIVHDEIVVTYRELDARAEALAARLRAAGVGPDVPVAVGMPRSIGMIVTVLAIAKAGGVSVPLDADYPAARLAYMLEDSAAEVVVTTEALRSRFAERARAITVSPLGVAESSGDANRDAPRPRPARPVRDDDLAYIIYTSGSTGQPKGIAVTHLCLGDLLVWHRDRDVERASKRTLQFASISFDVFFQEMYLTLLSGGALHLIADDERRDPSALRRILTEQKIDRLFLPFVALQQLAHVMDEPEAIPSLKQVITAGEALHITPDIARMFSAPWRTLENHYGPSETHAATAHELRGRPDSWPAAPPIGRPVANTTIYVVDRYLRPVPLGAAGEIVIGGPRLARGYWRRPALTAEKFIPDPFSDEPGARLYRTGDLARWTNAGELEFLGRIDHQVKVRGIRIELGEIEASILRVDSVREAVAVARQLDGGHKQLVAYVVLEAGASLDVETLRAHLKAKLPEYMVPSAFVFLDALPLTPSGKVDRKALPAPDVGLAASEYVAPRSGVEEVLCALFADVLRLPRVGIHDNFFELGGHSLLATQVVARIRSALHRELPLRTIFEAPTVADLAGALASSSADVGDAFPLTATRRDGPSAVSFAQERLWFLDQLEPGGATYNIPAAVRLTGPLDVDALRRAFEAIVRRHDSLRTTFLDEGGQVRQVVSEDVRATLQVVDGVEGDEALRRHMRREATTPFDLARGPLVRASLLRLAADQHALLFTMHHIVSDGWSMGVVVNELGALYTAFSRGLPSPLAPLAVQYPDFAAWQRQWLEAGELQRQLAYWRAQLAGAPPSLDLPTDQVRPPIFSGRGRALGFVIPRDLANELRALATREGATLFMVLLAAFDLLLARYSGQSDLVVGTPIANRTRRELEPLVGFFVNTLALRARVDRGATFRSLVASVKQTTLDAYAHQDVPFERLVEDLAPARDASRTPLFQVMFALQNAPVGDVRLPGVSLEPLAVETQVTMFDLFLAVEDRDGELAATFEYATDLFEHATIGRMAEHLLNLLRAAAAEPGAKLSDLPLLSERERHTLLVAWNDTTTAFPRDRTIHQLFQEQVVRSPDATALVFEGEELSYRALDARANQLAHRLRREGVGPDVLVAVCLERSVELIVAILAIIKAGGAYVPIDLAYPKDRIAYVLRDANASLVLTGELEDPRLPPFGPKAQTPELERCKVLRLGPNDRERLARESTDDLAPTATPLNLAYVIYTSGSTGRAKGVGIPNRGVVRLVRDNLHSSFGPDDVFLQLASVAFDGSVTEIWGPLLNGGRLVVFPPRPPTMAELSETIRARGIGTLILTTGVFHQFVDEHVESVRGLRRFLVGGDTLSPAHAERVRREAPGVPLINLYGPTENSTLTTVYQLEGEIGRSVSIGRPVGNTQVYVLDADLRPVPVGVWGELYTSGDGLARGYWNRPGLTAERFLPNPFSTEPGGVLYRVGDAVRYRPDGNIEFLGRLDHQVKLRGFRIELDEIEQALRVLPAVRDAVVLLREDQPGHKRIVAYVVMEEAAAASNDELSASLKATLPEYMIPSAYVRLDVLPLTANGKTDKRALPAPEQPASTAAYVAPRGPLEQSLVEIWESVLPVPRVGIHDNFFELGGHSLLATQVVARIRSALNRELPLRTIFDAPTVALLAAALASDRPRSDGVLTRLATGTPGQRPLFFVHGVGGSALVFAHLARQVSALPFYGLSAPDGEAIEKGLTAERLGELYVAAIREVQPRGPYVLGGWSLGGVIAFEMARQLESQGERVELLVLLDSFAPRAGEAMPDEMGLFAAFSESLGTSWKALRLDLERVVQLSGADRWAYVFECARSSGVQLPPFVDGPESLGRLYARFERFVRMHHRYAPRPSKVPALVVSAHVAGTPAPEPDAQGWGGLLAGARWDEEIDADHDSMLRPPRVARLGVIITEHLSKAAGPKGET